MCATRPLHSVVLFRKDKRLVQAIDDEHRDEHGDLAFRQDFECSEKTEASPLALHLPSTLVSKDDRKLKAVVYVYSERGDFVEEFKPFEVHFPKP